MKSLKIISALLFCGCFIAFLAVRQPYSPTQNLPKITLTAFDFAPPADAAGEKLAHEASRISGVTAAAFNPNSKILSLSYTNATSEPALQKQLSDLAGQPLQKTVFPKSDAPECPVPAGLVAAFPQILLGLSALGGAALLLLFFLPKRKIDWAS